MKVAISVPDPLFVAAERASKRQRLSRSRFYAKALEAYLAREAGEEVTARLNAVYARMPPDPVIDIAALEVLRRERW